MALHIFFQPLALCFLCWTLEELSFIRAWSARECHARTQVNHWKRRETWRGCHLVPVSTTYGKPTQHFRPFLKGQDKRFSSSQPQTNIAVKLEVTKLQRWHRGTCFQSTNCGQPPSHLTLQSSSPNAKRFSCPWIVQLKPLVSKFTSYLVIRWELCLRDFPGRLSLSRIFLLWKSEEVLPPEWVLNSNSPKLRKFFQIMQLVSWAQNRDWWEQNERLYDRSSSKLFIFSVILVLLARICFHSW